VGPHFSAMENTYTKGSKLLRKAWRRSHLLAGKGRDKKEGTPYGKIAGIFYSIVNGSPQLLAEYVKIHGIRPGEDDSKSKWSTISDKASPGAGSVSLTTVSKHFRRGLV